MRPNDSSYVLYGYVQRKIKWAEVCLSDVRNDRDITSSSFSSASGVGR